MTTQDTLTKLEIFSEELAEKLTLFESERKALATALKRAVEALEFIQDKKIAANPITKELIASLALADINEDIAGVPV